MSNYKFGPECDGEASVYDSHSAWIDPVTKVGIKYCGHEFADEGDPIHA